MLCCRPQMHSNMKIEWLIIIVRCYSEAVHLFSWWVSYYFVSAKTHRATIAHYFKKWQKYHFATLKSLFNIITNSTVQSNSYNVSSFNLTWLERKRHLSYRLLGSKTTTIYNSFHRDIRTFPCKWAEGVHFHLTPRNLFRVNAWIYSLKWQDKVLL